MEDGEDVHSDIVQGLVEPEVIQGLDEEEDEEDISQLYEEVDSDVVSGSDAEGQLYRLEGMYDSSSDSESTSGYGRFVQALRAYKFERALAGFEPDFAGMRMVFKRREHDVPGSLPLHWLLSCTQYPAQRAVWLKLIEAVSRTYD